MIAERNRKDTKTWDKKKYDETIKKSNCREIKWRERKIGRGKSIISTENMGVCMQKRVQ